MRNEEDSSYKHILKYVGLFGSVQFLSVLIQLVRNKLVALILGPMGMGLNSLFNSTVQLISCSTNMGLDTSAVRRLSELYDQGLQQTLNHRIMVIRSWTMITALGGMMVCLLLSGVLSHLTFSSADHLLHFMALSPAIAMLAITGSETAILKSLRQLTKLARLSLLNVFLAVAITTPIFYFFRLKGIIPSILIAAFIQMILTLRASYRLAPLRISFRKDILLQGSDMLKLGISFVLAGVCASGADFAIRSILNNMGALDAVGLYNAGFVMTVTYAGLVFSSLSSDFFPRLSAVNTDVKESNLLINKQIEVSVMILAPMLIALVLGVPLLVPMLFSSEFLPIVSMVQIASLAMFLRAMKLPVAFLTLAKGASRDYFLLEAYSALVLVVCVIVGFRLWGITGTGVGLLVTGFIDYIVVNVYARLRFGYRMSFKMLVLSFAQLILLLGTFAICMGADLTFTYWLFGGAIVVVSLLTSFLFYIMSN